MGMGTFGGGENVLKSVVAVAAAATVAVAA